MATQDAWTLLLFNSNMPKNNNYFLCSQNRISFGVVVRSKGKRLSQIISNVDLWTIFLLNPPKTFQEYSPPSLIF